MSISLTLSWSILKSLFRFNLTCYMSWWRWMVSDSNAFVLIISVWEISRLLKTVKAEGMLGSSYFYALLPPINFWWKHQVDYIETGYQGATLQLARKSTHLPKCLLILKGPIWIFLGGPNSVPYGSAVSITCHSAVRPVDHLGEIMVTHGKGSNFMLFNNLFFFSKGVW